jgi:disulfide oxidoreductase YuzD
VAKIEMCMYGARVICCQCVTVSKHVNVFGLAFAWYVHDELQQV